MFEIFKILINYFHLDQNIGDIHPVPDLNPTWDKLDSVIILISASG